MFLCACAITLLPGASANPTFADAAPAPGNLLFVIEKSQVGAEPHAAWVCVWDLAKPELRAVVPGLPTDAQTVRPTADGKRFVLVCGDGWRVTQIATWDPATKKQIRTFDVPAKEAGQAAVSPDGAWVAYHPTRADATPRVWNTGTGARAEELETALGKFDGVLAFSSDSKRLFALTALTYTEYDVATGKVGKSRQRPERIRTPRGPSWAVPLPDWKGVVSVAATMNRRQSYVVTLHSEKKDWHLGEFVDRAAPPAVSPDGRLLIASGGTRSGAGTFALKIDADGAPELEDAPAKPVGPFARWGPGAAKQVPAWRVWALGDSTRAGYEPPGAVTFSSNGKRLFAAGRLGRIQAFDTERRAATATLFVAEPRKTELPEWHITTVTGEVAGSPTEVEALVKDGKVRNAAKVRAALGVK